MSDIRDTALDKETQESLTPDQVLRTLKEGNNRYVHNNLTEADFSQLRKQTKNQQNPHSIILSCIDSRVPVELVFDQSLGDIFVARIAGNFANTDIIGSLEFACKVAGSKLIVVLGHEQCGAIKAACDNIQLGNLTSTLSNIKPAVEDAKTYIAENHNSQNLNFVSQVIESNVHITINTILEHSAILQDLYNQQEIDIVGGIYMLASGKVKWL